MEKITFRAIIALFALSLSFSCVEKVDRRPAPTQDEVADAHADDHKATGDHVHPAEMVLAPGVYTMQGEGNAAILQVNATDEGWSAMLSQMEGELPEAAYFLEHADEFAGEDLGEISESDDGTWTFGSLGAVKLGADAEGHALLELLDMDNPLNKAQPAVLVLSSDFMSLPADAVAH